MDYPILIKVLAAEHTKEQSRSLKDKTKELKKVAKSIKLIEQDIDKLVELQDHINSITFNNLSDESIYPILDKIDSVITSLEKRARDKKGQAEVKEKALKDLQKKYSE